MVQKQSSAVLQFIALYSETGEHDPLFLTNYATINMIDRCRASRRRPGEPVRREELLDADLVRDRAADQPEPDAVRYHHGDPGQNVQARGRPHRRPADPGRPAVPDQHPDAGPARHARSSSATSCIRANPDGSMLRVRDVARVELGAQNQDTDSRLNGQPAVTIGIYLSPGANAVPTAGRHAEDAGRAVARASPTGLKALVIYDIDHLRRRHDPRGDQDPARGLRARRHRGLPVPRQRCARR